MAIPVVAAITAARIVGVGVKIFAKLFDECNNTTISQSLPASREGAGNALMKKMSAKMDLKPLLRPEQDAGIAGPGPTPGSM